MRGLFAEPRSGGVRRCTRCVGQMVAGRSPRRRGRRRRLVRCRKVTLRVRTLRWPLCAGQVWLAGPPRTVTRDSRTISRVPACVHRRGQRLDIRTHDRPTTSFLAVAAFNNAPSVFVLISAAVYPERRLGARRRRESGRGGPSPMRTGWGWRLGASPARGCSTRPQRSTKCPCTATPMTAKASATSDPSTASTAGTETTARRSSKPSASAAALASGIPTSAQARTPTHPTPNSIDIISGSTPQYTVLDWTKGSPVVLPYLPLGN